MKLTGGQALAAQLVREGVRHVFGVPGVQLDHAMDGLHGVANDITFVGTRHEQAAAYMADGYARTSAEIGVCSVVPGPGLLNAAAALSTAYACNSRVLCISGQIPSHTIGKGLGMLHEIPNQSTVLDSVTKWHALATEVEAIPSLIREAFAQLRSGPPRPVALEIPPDVLAAGAHVDLIDPPADEDNRTAADPDALARAAEILRGAQNPAIYVGGGLLSANAGVELQALAELLDAPVVMSPNGRGSLSDRHPLALNFLAGRKVLPDSDVVLAVGTRFITGAGTQVATPAETKLIMINADAAHFGPPRRVDVALHADAALGLRALIEALTGHTPTNASGERIAAAKAFSDEQIAQIEPQLSYLKALRTAIPDDGILVNELTQVGYLARVGYPYYAPRTNVSPGYQGTLGYGFATALGAKVANPDRVVVSINGDGGFSWNLQELSTMRKYNIGAVAVVFNDGAFGNVRRTQVEDFDSRYIGTDLVNPDYQQLAAAFGITSSRVNSPDGLHGALVEAIASGQPTLVEVTVGVMPSAWHLIR